MAYCAAVAAVIQGSAVLSGLLHRSGSGICLGVAQLRRITAMSPSGRGVVRRGTGRATIPGLLGALRSCRNGSDAAGMFSDGIKWKSGTGCDIVPRTEIAF